MIDIGRILKRAWQVLWDYKVLWIFGVLLGVTTAPWGRTGSRVSPNVVSPGVNLNGSPFLQGLNRWFEENVNPVLLHPERFLVTLVWIGIGLVLLAVVVWAVLTLLRYVSEAALIRMVSDHEQTGQKAGLREGWRLGWSRAAFRMWLIDLIIALPALVFVLLLLGLGLAAYFRVRGGMGVLGVAGLILVITLALSLTLAFILLMVLLTFLSQFFKRSAALEGSGVGESFRRGWKMVKRNWKSAALVWLVLFGLGIAFAIAWVIVTVLLIPVFVVLALPGLIVAAVPALLAFGMASLFTGGPLPWIIAILAGAPFFLLVVGSPLLLMDGWVQVFSSSVWTLTFREMKALEVVAHPES